MNHLAFLKTARKPRASKLTTASPSQAVVQEEDLIAAVAVIAIAMAVRTLTLTSRGEGLETA